MSFYHGFALADETHFFDAYRKRSDYTLSSFSYGAIKAFEAALVSTKRIDTLQLFSPAFFQDKPEKYKRLQLMGYKKDASVYVDKFTQNCFSPLSVQPLHYGEYTLQELDELLNYVWKAEALKALVQRGTMIEVYLGGQDKISDVKAAYDFFVPFATVTLIKNANHFLQGEQHE